MSIFNTKTLKGSQLTDTDKSYVLAVYVHRYTGNNRPSHCKGYPLQFKNDQDWLEHTEFAVTKYGRLDMRFKHCHSKPTWPENQTVKNKGLK